jgi:hypothetical protein
MKKSEGKRCPNCAKEYCAKIGWNKVGKTFLRKVERDLEGRERRAKGAEDKWTEEETAVEVTPGNAPRTAATRPALVQA